MKLLLPIGLAAANVLLSSLLWYQRVQVNRLHREIAIRDEIIVNADRFRRTEVERAYHASQKATIAWVITAYDKLGVPSFTVTNAMSEIAEMNRKELNQLLK